MKGTFFDGEHLKGFNIPLNWNSDFGWDVYGKDIEGAELYQRVSVVWRAFNLNADALATIPFALIDKAGNDYDVSTAWENKVGFMPNPSKLLRLWRKSLSMKNAAYGLLEKRDDVNLRYIVPTTITPDVNQEKGLVGFWRQVGANRIYYPLKEHQLIHMFKMDYDTEVLPSENTEFEALMMSAGVLYYADYFVRNFFKRGGIKPTMLMAKGVPSAEERERMESIWDKLMRGLTKNIGKIWNAESIEPKVIGSGVDDLKDNPVYDRAIDNIASVTGIPKRILIGSERGELASSQDTKNWFDNVVTWAEFMQEELNENLFRYLDLKLDFRPEMTEPDQEEESKRSQAFVNYAGVLLRNGNPQANSIAAQIVGVDLPPDMEYADLDARDENRLPQNPFQQQQDNKPGDLPKPQIGENDQPQKSVVVAQFVPNPEQVKELKTWQDVVTRKHKRGEWPPAVWVSQCLPADLVAGIQAKLRTADELKDVKSAFDLTETRTPAPEYSQDDTALLTLADAINRLAEREVEERN